MNSEICGGCSERVHMDYEKDYDHNTLVGAYVSCPECGYTYYQGRP